MFEKYFLKFIIIGSLIMTNVIWSQQNLLTGVVLDAESKAPLVGASVQIIETNYQTNTNQSGEFLLYSNAKQITIKTSYIGFEAQTLKIKESLVKNWEILKKMQGSQKPASDAPTQNQH